jgi:hypothetical protein
MDGHVWRVPVLLGVMAVCSLTLFAARVVAAMLARRRTSSLVRVGVATAVVSFAAVASVIAGQTTSLRFAQMLEIDVTHVEPGPLAYLATAAFSEFAFLVGRRMLGGVWTSRSALIFYAWLVVFTAANVIDWCSPG